MTSGSVILQKKLHELESELTDVFRLPLDPTATDPRLQVAFDDIKQRIIFLNNLYWNEAVSQPETSDELREIGNRLIKIEADFRDWNAWRLSICSDCTQALLQGDVRESDSPIAEAESASGEISPEKFSYSFATDENVKIEDCTDQAILNGDARGSGSPISEAEEFSGEKSTEKFVDSLGKDEINVRKNEAAPEEKAWSKMGKYGGVFGCGMIVGIICMVKLVSSPHQFIEFEALLLPPT